MKRRDGRSDGTFFIYAVEVRHGASIWTKIGFAQNLASRLAGIQTGCPLPISRFRYLEIPFPGLIRDRDYLTLVEGKAHIAVGHARIHGEWFECACDDDLTSSISKALVDVIDQVPQWQQGRGRKPRRSRISFATLANREASIMERYQEPKEPVLEAPTAAEISIIYRQQKKRD